MSYGVFAQFYDGLTRNVDYSAKADYLCELLKFFDCRPECMLDLACGTGTLTIELKKRGFDVFGVDGSFEMLSQAQQKAAENDFEMLFLCQQMQKLELYGLIDSCVCTLDSISHLQGLEQVRKTFERISKYMEKDGLFIFDVNTIYKHSVILGNNTFVYDTDEVFCVWQNTYNDKNHSVKIDLDFFVPENDVYSRYTESFREFAYSVEELSDLLEQCGFSVLAVYDDMTFCEPKHDSQRVTFAAKKR